MGKKEFQQAATEACSCDALTKRRVVQGLWLATGGVLASTASVGVLAVNVFVGRHILDVVAFALGTLSVAAIAAGTRLVHSAARHQQACAPQSQIPETPVVGKFYGAAHPARPAKLARAAKAARALAVLAEKPKAERAMDMVLSRSAYKERRGIVRVAKTQHYVSADKPTLG